MISKIAIAAGKRQLSEADRQKIRGKWASADFATLEPWKVDNSVKTLASSPRYLGA